MLSDMITLILLLFTGLWDGSRGDLDWSNHEPEMCIYHKNYTIPLQNGRNAFDVFVRVAITDLYEISEAGMDFGMQCFILETWKDPLLKLEGVILKKVENIPQYIIDCIWTPDIIFPNCKNAKLYKVTVPHTVIKVIPDGYLYRYSRYHLTVKCQMDFRIYPMDVQKCFLNITLFSSRTPVADLSWMGTLGSDKSPNFMKRIPTVKIFPGVQPLKFSMLKPRVESHFNEAVSGNQTVLQVHFTFVRHLTASLVNTYIPSLLVICLSMVSFWIDVSAVPGRVTLGVTALLTLTTEIVHARSLIPPVDYMTAMDVWLFGCLLMVFLSLLEFTMAQAYARKCARRKKMSANLVQTVNKVKPIAEISSPHRHDMWTSSSSATRNRKEGKPKKGSSEHMNYQAINIDKDEDNLFDKYSRILFPSLLVMFVICYWLYYLHNGETYR